MDIYKYVRNNFEFEIYIGSRKGSQETLKQRRGNDYDLSSVLLALLRESDIHARYNTAAAVIPTSRFCNWLGIAGQFFNANGDPVQNVLVAVVGNVGGQSVEGTGYTGLVDGYGPGGYEIKLSSTVGPGIFWLQAYDQDGNPVTDVFNFQIAPSCDNNLALVNFRQAQDSYTYSLPMIENH